MTALVDSPVSAEVEAVPTGVSAPDGSELYLQVPGGIEAVDPETGATRWATRAAAVPVLVLDGVLLALATAPAGDVYAVVDDGMPPHPWHECRTDNNTSAVVDPACGIPQ